MGILLEIAEVLLVLTIFLFVIKKMYATVKPSKESDYSGKWVYYPYRHTCAESDCGSECKREGSSLQHGEVGGERTERGTPLQDTPSADSKEGND